MTLFIDETYVKRTNAIDESVEAKLITPCIEKAQEVFILGLLGTALYEELINQIENDTLTPENIKLLTEYIAPALSKWSYSELIPKLIFKNENTSILKRSAENATPIDFKEMIYLRDLAINDAEFRATRLTKYLNANLSLYPLFSSPGNSLDTVHPQRNNSYISNIYMRKSIIYNGKDKPRETE